MWCFGYKGADAAGEMKVQLLEEVVLDDEAERRVARLEDVRSEPAVGAGENFASAISRVTTEAVLTSGKRVVKSLILKKMPSKETQVGFLESHAFFQTEILLYKEILPLMEDALRERGIPSLWPSFLGEKGDYLVFSDLKSKNYRIGCRKARLDLEHAILAARTLGVFHGGSMHLKIRGELNVEGLPPTFLTRNTPEIRLLIEGGIRTAAKVIKDKWGPAWKDIGERLHKKSFTLSEELYNLQKLDNSIMNVVCHGDLWTTNLMFKYSMGTDSPIGVKFIDFQLAHYNSFAFDLIYFMNTSLPATLRRSSVDDILKAYHRGLTDCLEAGGMSFLNISFEEIKAEVKQMDLYNFASLLTIMPISTADVDNAIDFDSLVSGKGDVIVHHPELFTGKFKQEVDQDLLQWSKEGLF